jgi:hypothetical protein
MVNKVVESLLSYATIKIVVIKDWRLGAIHHGFQLVILLYIIVYMIVIQQRFLRTEQPYGSVRSTLREPSNWTDATALPYCLQNQPRQVNDAGDFTNYNCIFALGNDVTYPPAPQDSIYASTRVKQTTYRLPPNCTSGVRDPRSVACAPKIVGSSESVYVADIEDFTVFMEHAIYGQINNIATTNNNIKGELHYQGRSEDDYELLSGPRAGDIFTLRKVLEAAGVPSLDVPSGVGGTYRYDGIEIVVIIKYANRASNAKELKYSYTMNVVPKVDSVAYEPSAVVNATDMVVTKRNGIKLIYIIAGTIGVFDFQTLITNLVGSIVLLKAATTIVDILMEYVLPEKLRYKSHKYEQSDDSAVEMH